MGNWTYNKFQARIQEFLHDNPDLSYRQACSILGRRGAENRNRNRKTTSIKKVEKQNNQPCIIINNSTVYIYGNSKPIISQPKQLELNF